MSYWSFSKSNSVVLEDVLLEKKKRYLNVLISYIYIYTHIISACFYVQVSDRRRFQMMICVPVFPNGGELIASTSRRSFFRVLNGEYCRMSCRLASSLSLTQGKVDVKGESSGTFIKICVFPITTYHFALSLVSLSKEDTGFIDSACKGYGCCSLLQSTQWGQLFARL